MTNAIKTAKMISLRTFLLRTTSGHMIRFTKGEPRDVPLAVVRAAMEAGCAMADDAPLDVFKDTKAVRLSVGGPLRDSILYLACKRVKDRNDTKEFTAGGIPRVPAIEKLTGFDVTQRDVETMFRKVVADERENNEVQLHPSADVVLRVYDAEDRDELLLIAVDYFNTEELAALEGLSQREVRQKLLSRLAEVN